MPKSSRTTAPARRLDPQAHRRPLHLPAAGSARPAQGRTDCPRGNGPRRRPGGPHARPPTPRNLAAERTLRNRPRRLVQGPRPRQEGMGSRPDPRGSHHHAGRRRIQLLPPVSQEFLPNPDQVPRRNPPPLRPHARQGIHHEGRLQLRRHRRGGAGQLQENVRRLHPHLPALRPQDDAVEADTGVMGGKFSHEFMVPAETGENEVVYCEACHYAANIDKASSRLPRPSRASPRPRPSEKFATPGVATIEAFDASALQLPANRQIKTLVYMVEGKLALILMRGDHQLNEAKLAGALGTATFRARRAGGDFRRAGRPSRKPRRGGRHETAHLCRRKLARRRRHDHRRQRGRLPPAPRRYRPRHRCQQMDRLAPRPGRRTLPQMRPAAQNPAAPSRSATSSSSAPNTARP